MADHHSTVSYQAGGQRVLNVNVQALLERYLVRSITTFCVLCFVCTCIVPCCCRTRLLLRLPLVGEDVVVAVCCCEHIVLLQECQVCGST